MRANLTSRQLKEIVGLLKPTREVRVLLRDELGRLTRRLIELTAQQLQILRGLRANRRACIAGGAGTGKTVLAIEKARDFAEWGLNTLLVCYNAPLAEHLGNVVSGHARVTACTFHSLCVKEARAAGLHVPATPSRAWWEGDSAGILAEATTRNQTTYDALVIDEGQDFSGEWMTALLLTLADPDDSPVYAFIDSHQALYDRRFEVPVTWPRFDLTRNCRNSLPIATAVSAVFGDQLPPEGADGPPVHFRRARNRALLLEMVQDELVRFLEREGLGAHQVVIITDSADTRDRLCDLMAGETPIVPEGGSGVLCTTIKRYKGLESDVVVSVFSDAALASRDDAQHLAYVGMSRPRGGLVVIAEPRWAYVLDPIIRPGNHAWTPDGPFSVSAGRRPGSHGLPRVPTD